MLKSETQQILEQFQELNKNFEDSKNAYFIALRDVRKDIKDFHERIDEIQTKLEPMYEIFENVSRFNRVTIYLLKAVIMIGAGLGVLYGFIKYLKE